MRSTRYEMYVSGSPRPAQDPRRVRVEEPAMAGDGAGYGRPQAPPKAHANPPKPVVRRFPPVLQFLTEADALLQQQLWTLATQAYRKGLTLQQICEEVYYHARALGYEAALGVQEVYSAGMPSFPDQTVLSALVLVDLRPVPAPEGYHGGRTPR